MIRERDRSGNKCSILAECPKRFTRHTLPQAHHSSEAPSPNTINSEPVTKVQSQHFPLILHNIAERAMFKQLKKVERDLLRKIQLDIQRAVKSAMKESQRRTHSILNRFTGSLQPCRLDPNPIIHRVKNPQRKDHNGIGVARKPCE